MPTNFYMIFVAALIPMVVGAIYYHPKLVGKSWMNLNGFTEESLQEGNPITLFGSAYLLSVVAAFALIPSVIHQSIAYQLMMPEVLETGSEAANQFSELMSKFGDSHRSFKHGALHGGILAVFLVLPLIGINALFERRGWKYIFIHLGYWFITLALMGGLLCATLKYEGF